MDSSTWIIIGISAVFLTWFVAGSLVGRQIGQKYSKWFQEGLSVFHGEVNSKMLGFPVSGGRFTITEGRDRLEKGEVLFLISSRENLPLFISNRLQGVRDEMLFRGTIKNPPGFDAEVGRSNDRRFNSFLNRDPQKPFHTMAGPDGFTYAWRGEKNTAIFERLIAFQQQYLPFIIRVSIRREEPNLVLRMEMDIYREKTSAQIFKDFLAVIS